MCNRFEYEGTFYSLAGDYEATPIGNIESEGDAAKHVVFPRYLTPGLIRNATGKREMHPMQFAFSTPGMKTPYHPKKNRNNARIEEVDNPKSAWMNAFREHRCILPMNAFHEPCYWGETAKKKVYFERPDNQVLHGAAIYRVWNSPDGGAPLYTVSLLIGPARPYVMDHGHERQPIFITEDGLSDWLKPTQLPTEDAKQILRDYFADPELTYRVDGTLADSTWNKNETKKLRDRDKQLTELEKIAHSCGF